MPTCIASASKASISLSVEDDLVHVRVRRAPFAAVDLSLSSSGTRVSGSILRIRLECCPPASGPRIDAPGSSSAGSGGCRARGKRGSASGLILVQPAVCNLSDVNFKAVADFHNQHADSHHEHVGNQRLGDRQFFPHGTYRAGRLSTADSRPSTSPRPGLAGQLRGKSCAAAPLPNRKTLRRAAPCSLSSPFQRASCWSNRRRGGGFRVVTTDAAVSYRR